MRIPMVVKSYEQISSKRDRNTGICLGGRNTSYLLISAISSSICCSLGAWFAVASPRSAVETAIDNLELTEGRRDSCGWVAEKEVVREDISLRRGCDHSQLLEDGNARC